MLRNFYCIPVVRGFFFTAAVIGLLFCCYSPAAGEDSAADYKKEIEDWHQARIERLKSKEGYLALVGLFPLKEGANGFGSAEDNDLVFPAKAPAHAGVFTLKQGLVRITVFDDATITEGDIPVREKEMKSDAEKPTTNLAMGTFRFYVIERSGQLYLRLKDVESELLEKFTGIDRFPVNESWRIKGRFEPYDPPKQLKVPNVLGYEFEQTCPGRVVFEAGGQTCFLEPTSASHSSLFFVFGDETSAVETYGGGRFLVAAPPSEDGTVYLDFNKAYNPPCAFTPFATCPLPHAANLLRVRIEAGELNYGDPH